MLEFAIAEDFSPTVGDKSGPAWLEALPARIYHTPLYGEVVVPTDKLERMVEGFKKNIRGQEIATNFDHGADKAKGNQASGWFKDFALKPSSADSSQMSLYAAVEFTDEAKKEIKDGKWKYFSLEWEDQWKDNAGNEHKDVIVGGAVTNRPIAKNMATLPVNFSETLWNDLDEETKSKVTKMSEEVKGAVALLQSNGYTVKNESREWEHSEPGTGPAPRIGDNPQPDPGTTQPVPRVQGDPAKDDPAIGGGWRREPLPLETNDPNAPKGERDEGGSALTPEELIELKKNLGLKDDADIATVLTTAKTAFSESVALKNAVENASEEKRFAENFPTMWREHQDLLAGNRETRAVAFSESVKQIKRAEGESFIGTDKGLSAAALDAISDTHKKFAEGTATAADFENTITAITQGGIVDFSEQGSTKPRDLVEVDTNTPGGVANARKLFAEKVVEIQAADKLEYAAAINAASLKYPELAAAYRIALPA